MFAYLYGTSLLHICIAYLYCEFFMRILIASLYCISLAQIFIAYLHCKSILRMCDNDMQYRYATQISSQKLPAKYPHYNCQPHILNILTKTGTWISSLKLLPPYPLSKPFTKALYQTPLSNSCIKTCIFLEMPKKSVRVEDLQAVRRELI